MIAEFPMFPLNGVLFPHTATTLHIFEPRYRALARHCTDNAVGFGTVLIERGHEVGGGDTRFPVGTVLRIIEAAELEDGRWLLAVEGTGRLRIQRWLPDAPYPVAAVVELDEAPLPPSAAADLARAEQAVRRALAYTAELGERAVAATVEFNADPSVALWQLAAAAPLGQLDKQALLASADGAALLAGLLDAVGSLNALLEERLRGL